MTHNQNILTHTQQKIKIGARGLQKRKFYLPLLVLVTLAGTLSVSPTIPLLMYNVTIRSSGTISFYTNVTARSGSPEDIQAAVDMVEAAGGGTVYIPEGDFEFNFGYDYPAVTSIGGVNIIGAGKNLTILRETEPVVRSTGAFFGVDGNNGKPVRISGISFKRNVLVNDPATNPEDYKATGIEIRRTKDFRIDHCDFWNFTSIGIYVGNDPGYISRGVIDHCDFDNPYHDLELTDWTEWGYAVVVTGDYDYGNWLPIDRLLGKFENNVVYVEDCTFSRTRHTVASNAGAWYVIRHCTTTEERPQNYGMIDVHGDPGGRGLEAYDNIVYGCEYSTPGQWLVAGFDIRGGGGVIYNNTIIDCGTGILLEKEQSSWPERQVHDLYIWNNNFTGEHAGTFLNPDAYTEDVDYFLYEKSYTPYPYPHPLTLETTP